ncbi:MAG: hypothetical protein MUE59_06190 [Thiobacillaceae bacterium]|jgi:hypothetical protein|nr:hypothetical protein [Thiobacillaceae bacterium]
MKYKITKAEFDGRLFTHHVYFPDGYYRIYSLTRTNHANLESLIARGYEVEEYDGPLAAGLYDEETDKRVDPLSVLRVASPSSPDTAVVELPQDAPDDCATLGIRPREMRAQKRRRISPQEARQNSVDDLRNTLSALKVGYRVSDSRDALEAKLQRAMAKAS